MWNFIFFSNQIPSSVVISSIKLCCVLLEALIFISYMLGQVSIFYSMFGCKLPEKLELMGGRLWQVKRGKGRIEFNLLPHKKTTEYGALAT